MSKDFLEILSVCYKKLIVFFSVKFAPSEECDRVWQKRKLLEQQEQTLGNGYVFDGAMMWSANRYTTPGAGLVLHSQFEVRKLVAMSSSSVLIQSTFFF